MVTQLLATKLYSPPLHPGLVPRPRLHEQLDAGLQGKLSLISSPAGFGKTTLICAWIHHQRKQDPGTRAAWLSLDPADNDPVRFLAYLIAALRRVDDRIGQDALRLLESPRILKGSGASADEELLTLLINEIEALPSQPWNIPGSTPAQPEGGGSTRSIAALDRQSRRDLLLVMDDYQVVQAQAIHDAVAFLIEHMPRRLHLVIVSRTDPPLPVARLRGQGQVTELRQHDLSFTPDEAKDFLEEAAGLKLGPDHQARLLARTEGWIAGLQMAAVSMRGRQDIANFIETFAGSDRFVMDYLVEEVLSQQPASLQAFLLQTSILERLTGPLCDALLTESQASLVAEQPVGDATTLAELPFAVCSGQQVLEHLERANLFLVALDDRREWYRYHHLFADLLRQRLQQVRPDLPQRLHRRASQWYERSGLLPQAITHALSAGDHGRAADLTEQVAEEAWMNSKVTTLLGWIEALPGEVLHGRPMLGIYYVLALLMSGRPMDTVEARLRDQTRAATGEAEDETGELSAGLIICQALIAAYQGQAEASARLSARALDLLPQDSLLLRSLVAGVLALAHMYSGDTATATRSLEKALQVSRQAGNIMNAALALCHLAELCLLEGQLGKAEKRYEEALALAVDEKGQRLPVAGMALIGLGHILLERNDLTAAGRCVLEGIRLSSRWGEPGALQGYTVLARLKKAEGDFSEARSLLQKAAQIAARFDAMDMDDVSVGIAQAQLALAEGDLEGAERWARECGLHTCPEALALEAKPGQDSFMHNYLRESETLTLVRMLMVRGGPQAREGLEWASKFLEQSLSQAKAHGQGWRTIEVLALSALVSQARGDAAEAAQALDRALPMARSEGYVRIFVDEGEPMAALLQEAFLRGTTPHYVRQLLQAMGVEVNQRPQLARPPQASLSHGQQPLVEALSKRELEVLRFLATSLSSTEIAEHLYVSVNTVRSHIRHIYGKLDAHSRIEALTRAQELNLI